MALNPSLDKPHFNSSCKNPLWPLGWFIILFPKSSWLFQYSHWDDRKWVVKEIFCTEILFVWMKRRKMI